MLLYNTFPIETEKDKAVGDLKKAITVCIEHKYHNQAKIQYRVETNWVK